MITVAIPADKFHHFQEAVDAYLERLPDLRLAKLPVCKTQDAARAVREETKSAAEWLAKKREFTVFLHETGKKCSSRDFAAKLQGWRASRGNVRFLIGGSYGFDRAALAGLVDETLSLGDVTLPHALAAVVLLEQVYRAGQIAKGTGYHH